MLADSDLRQSGELGGEPKEDSGHLPGWAIGLRGLGFRVQGLGLQAPESNPPKP